LLPHELGLVFGVILIKPEINGAKHQPANLLKRVEIKDGFAS
jgi:hypothetical protein